MCNLQTSRTTLHAQCEGRKTHDSRVLLTMNAKVDTTHNCLKLCLAIKVREYIARRENKKGLTNQAIHFFCQRTLHKIYFKRKLAKPIAPTQTRGNDCRWEIQLPQSPCMEIMYLTKWGKKHRFAKFCSNQSSFFSEQFNSSLFFIQRRQKKFRIFEFSINLNLWLILCYY